MTQIGLTATLTALNRDWVGEGEASAPLPRSWGLTCPHLGPPATRQDLPHRASRAPDSVFRALIALHHMGDQLAGRAIVQLMLGKMVLMARRDPVCCLDDYLAALWERIATYPLERRPCRIPANLALDTLKSVKSLVPRRLPELPSPVAPDPLGDADAVLDAGVRIGAIDPVTRRTLACVYVEGRTSRDAAEELGVSADAVRWRCSRGVRALRAVVGQLIADVAG